MQPIIRHVIMVTIKETWTIRWQDATETVWHQTHTVVWPTGGEAGEQLPQTGEDNGGRDNAVFDLDAADRIVDED